MLRETRCFEFAPDKFKERTPADFVDFEREMKMPFVLSKISNHGSSNPIVARLHLQSHELLAATNLDQEQRARIFDTIFNAAIRLLRCHDIWTRLLAEYDKALTEHQPGHLPYIINLQHEAETFLYEAKNFLRDLTGVLNGAFGAAFNEARDFCPSKNETDSKIAKWIASKLGPDARLVVFLRNHYDWVCEVIAMRNAIEHPGGYSGVLHVRNFELLPDGSLRPPVWHRNDNPPVHAIADMRTLTDWLLHYAEELVVLVVETKLNTKLVQIAEIPDDKRDPKCPKRFVITASNELLKKFPRAPSAG